jgi:tetratricopeptide (TPR) repeat protein
MNVTIWVIALLAWQQPQDVKDVMNEGVAEFKAGHYQEAIQRFEQAVMLQPDNVNTRLYLGTAYQQLYVPGAQSPENLEAARRAESEFKRVLDLDPNNTTALSSLTALAFKSAASLTYEERARRIDEAIAWNDRVVMMDPTSKSALYWAGVLRWSNFYPAYMTARRDDGLVPGALGPIRNSNVRVALMNEFGPSVEKAISRLREAVKIDPEYADAMSYLNLLIRERADLRDTQDEYQRDIREADHWLDRALAAKRRQGAQNLAPLQPPALQLQSQAVQPTPQRIRVADITPIRKVDPVCPMEPHLRISGIVRFTVTIGKDGSLVRVQLVSGHPLLVPGAMDAVKQWRFEPRTLNSEPVEVIAPLDIYMNCTQQ